MSEYKTSHNDDIAPDQMSLLDNVFDENEYDDDNYHPIIIGSYDDPEKIINHFEGPDDSKEIINKYEEESDGYSDSEYEDDNYHPIVEGHGDPEKIINQIEDESDDYFESDYKVPNGLDVVKKTINKYAEEVLEDEIVKQANIDQAIDDLNKIHAEFKKNASSDMVTDSDQDLELVEALALIAAQEEAEKNGILFDIETAKLKFQDDSGIKTEQDTFQFPDCNIYIGTCYRKPGHIDGKDIPICHGHGMILSGNIDTDKPIYEGAFVHGKKQGDGIFNDYGTQLSISGVFYKDFPHGYCTCKSIMTNKKVFEGEYQNGNPHGYGRCFHGNTIYSGQQVDMKVTGQGTISEISDDKEVVIYEGEIVNNARHGYGTATTLDGTRWSGTFDGGDMTGVYESITGFICTHARFEMGVLTEITLMETIKLTPEEREELRLQEEKYFREEVEIYI